MVAGELPRDFDPAATSFPPDALESTLGISSADLACRAFPLPPDFEGTPDDSFGENTVRGDLDFFMFIIYSATLSSPGNKQHKT